MLKPLSSAVPAKRSYTLNTLPLVITEAALLRLGASDYHVNEEGLYRIRDERTKKIVRQCIVYRGDVWQFAGHLDRLYVYGTRHQGETQAKWDERVRNGEPLSLQCGLISLFVHNHLSAQQVPVRTVICQTGSKRNGYNDGHVVMEICDPAERRWMLFDPTLGARFKHGGRWLNLLEMTQLYRAGRQPEHVEFVNASSKVDPLMDYDRFYAGHIADKAELAAFLGEFKLLLKNDAAAIHRWYGRVMQIPWIANHFCPGSDAEDAIIRTIPSLKNLERLSVEEFRKRSYGEPCCPPR